VAQDFGVEPKKARRIAREVGVAIRSWRKDAAQWGASKEEVELMRSAFDHEDLRKALK